MMGIKENFSQAIRELTGADKKEKASTPAPPNPDAAVAATSSSTVDELRKGIYDDAPPREISLDTDEDMAATVRPISQARPVDPFAANADAVSQESVDVSTPVADEFLSGGELPVSLFGGQPPVQPVPLQGPIPPTPPVAPPPVQAAPTPTPVAPPPVQAAPAPTPISPPPVQAAPIPVAPPPVPPPGVPFEARPRPVSNVQVPVPTPSIAKTSDSSDSELTVISRNTQIDGNIRSFADMSIDGEIKGDVETTKNIDLDGKVVGNISCNNALMHASKVQGNVRMKGNVCMKRDTLLIGDLMSTYAEVNGKVKGNLDVVGKADLRGDAVVFGDISASTITVEDGAIIQGYVSTTFLNKEESRNLFPDAIVIDESARA
ncbi:MAG: polymer-forming cytoskeletal protein [Oscillospiraceae bacterium]|nr:polymer-forming cytoskeletal protein [Oscillospiraceae bacterium]